MVREKFQLNELILGNHYFETAILFRETVFLSALLLNSETWFDVKETDLQELENLDKMLLRRILQAPITSPIPSLYLELGIVPIRFKIQVKRLLFLHDILNSNQEETMAKVFWAQFYEPIEGDWPSTIKNDLKMFELSNYSLNEFKEFKGLKKRKLKNILKAKSKKLGYTFLMQEKEENCKSKMKNLSYSELKMQSYLKTKNISTAEKQILYKFRTRMISVNFNFGLQISCPLCLKENDTQEHLFTCEKLNDGLDMFDYQQIFSNNAKHIITAAQLCKKMYIKREKLLQDLNNHVHNANTL